MPLVEILYTCHQCGLKDKTVLMDERADEEEILGFVHRVQVAVGNDHAEASPACPSTTCDIKVPIAGDKIGATPRQ